MTHSLSLSLVYSSTRACGQISEARCQRIADRRTLPSRIGTVLRHAQCLAHTAPTVDHTATTRTVKQNSRCLSRFTRMLLLRIKTTQTPKRVQARSQNRSRRPCARMLVPTRITQTQNMDSMHVHKLINIQHRYHRTLIHTRALRPRTSHRPSTHVQSDWTHLIRRLRHICNSLRHHTRKSSHIHSSLRHPTRKSSHIHSSLRHPTRKSSHIHSSLRHLTREWSRVQVLHRQQLRPAPGSKRTYCQRRITASTQTQTQRSQTARSASQRTRARTACPTLVYGTRFHPCQSLSQPTAKKHPAGAPQT